MAAHPHYAPFVTRVLTPMFAAGSMFLASRLVWGVLFAMMGTVYMVYQVQVAQLNPLQLVLVGTALEVSAFVFEVPTGIVADRYSRKLSVVVGFAVIGGAFVLAGCFPHFLMLVAAAVVWGLGWTFVSGAQAAWLADEIGDFEAGKLYLKGQRLESYGSFLGILVAAALGAIQLAWPLLLSGVLFMAWSLVAWLGMAERGFEHVRGEGGDFSDMLKILDDGVATVRRSPTLVLLVIVGVIIGTFSEGYDRLSVAHLLRDFHFPAPFGAKPVVVLGAMSATVNLLSILAVHVLESRVNTDDARHIGTALSWMSAIIAACALGFALSDHVWVAIALGVLLNPLRVVSDPLTTLWINRHVRSASRATVLSLHSQADALGQMAGGPAVGFIGKEYGARIAIAVSALLLLPAVWLYRRARNL